MTKNLYDTLGVNKKSSAEDIKKAYKKKASENHPDKGGDNDKMTEITHAYSVLGNAKGRNRYDTTGEEKETPFDVRFQEFVQTFFIKIIESYNVEQVDLVEELKDVARKNIAGTNQVKADSDKKLKKMQKVLDRLTVKGDNKIGRILGFNIDNVKMEIANLEDHLKFMADVMECLDSYHYKFEQVEDEGFSPSFIWSVKI